MANIKSSQKKARQRIRREARNVARKSTMRTAVKRARAAITAGKKDAAHKALATAVTLLDRAAGKGVIKPRTASRSVSRLQTAINALK